MKINVHSISFKLILGGVAAVLIPLIIVGFLSFSKAQNALMALSKNRAQGIASDLAKMTHRILESEANKVAAMANQKLIVTLAASVDTSGFDSSSAMAKEVFRDLRGQFFKMGNHYQGIFIADTSGNIYTGILNNGDVSRE